MQVNIPKEILNIIKKFENKKFEIYITGGAVRDLLMGKEVNDWDFATNATPDEILKLFKKDEAFYDNKFGTVGIKPKDPNLKPHEITTYRHESNYTDLRRPEKIKWGKTLSDDLKRRDFTINAMTLQIQNLKGKNQNYKSKVKIIDKFDGQKDLENKLIRAVGNADERFSEDALRMMRAVRIAAELGFGIEEKTKDAIKKNSALINKIANERVRDEFLKILSSPNPYEGIVNLREVDLLKQFLPELEECFKTEQKSPQRHHIYNVGIHQLMSLKNCRSENVITRLATLIHDTGKHKTYKKLDSGIITFYNHEMVSTKIAKEVAFRLRLSNNQKELLIKLVRWHQFSVGENQTDKAIRRFIKHVGKENLKEMLELRRADRLGGGAKETSWRTEEFKKRLIEAQKQPFTIHDLKITGTDVMKILEIKPGPKVGESLNKLFDEVVEKKLENTKKELLKRLKKINNT